MEEEKDMGTEETAPHTTKSPSTNSREGSLGLENDGKTTARTTSSWSADPKRKQSLTSETQNKDDGNKSICGQGNRSINISSESP